MGAISVYTYNTNKNIQRHQHSYGHIIVVLENEFWFSFSGHSYRMTVNEVGFIPPGVPHEFSCSGRALTLNIPAEMVEPGDIALLKENSVMEITDDLAPLIDLIKREVRNSGPQNDSLRYLFYYLYDKFVSCHRTPSLRYINEHYAEDLSIAQLAAMENYNPSYFASLFRKRTGTMPGNYIKRVRIEKAKEILASTRYRVVDVAMQVGYKNASSFTRAFRAVAGVTPNQYRRYAKREEANKQ